MDKRTYLNEKQQFPIVRSLIEDKELLSVLKSIDQNSFTDPTLRIIVGRAKEYYDMYDTPITWEVLRAMILEKARDDIDREVFNGYINELQKEDTNEYAKDTIRHFTEQQLLVKTLNKTLQMISKGGLDEAHKFLTSQLDRYSTLAKKKSEPCGVFDNIDEVLTYKRSIIPTHIKELDDELFGGIEKRAITLIACGTGVGKTTLTTILANKMACYGNKVLQLFFEDDKAVIMHKHLAKVFQKPISQISDPKHKDEVLQMIADFEKDEPELYSNLKNNLKLERLRNNHYTTSMIRNYVKDIINKGFKIDVLFIDYLSCLKHKNDADPWKEEPQMLRELSNVADELNIAIVLTEQLNRHGNKGNEDGYINLQGSFAKAQIANTIISLGRTQEQKWKNLVDVRVDKCRNGRSGKQWTDAYFNNGCLAIDLSQSHSDVPFA